MPKLILAVNAGSSSVKITFFTLEQPPRTIVDAQVSGLTAPPAVLKYKRGCVQHKEEVKEKADTPQDAFKLLLKCCFEDPELSEVASSDDLLYTCHRVVHGGDYVQPVEITEDTLHHLEALEDLAPLHNFPALEIVRTCRKELPQVTSITYFDTSFHHTMPEYVKTYPIDQKVAKSKGLRKYGFHGLSYAFILRSVSQFLLKPQEETNLIVMHIGSGASICAIKEGKSIDTSMGLTPLAGLPGATRSGSIDPCLVFHYTSDAGKLSPASTKSLHISTAEQILNKESGWKAIAGTTDFAQIAVEKAPSDAHKLAFDIVIDRILGYIGDYYVKLDGKVDAIVFAGGVGEKSALLRRTLVEKARSLGVAIDSSKNEKGPDDDQTVMDISKEGVQGPKALICQTNEQFEMAYNCVLSAK